MSPRTSEAIGAAAWSSFLLKDASKAVLINHPYAVHKDAIVRAAAR